MKLTGEIRKIMMQKFVYNSNRVGNFHFQNSTLKVAAEKIN